METVKCPKCQLVNRPDAKFCGRCGAKLRTDNDIGAENVQDALEVSKRESAPRAQPGFEGKKVDEPSPEMGVTNSSTTEDDADNIAVASEGELGEQGNDVETIGAAAKEDTEEISEIVTENQDDADETTDSASAVTSLPPKQPSVVTTTESKIDVEEDIVQPETARAASEEVPQMDKNCPICGASNRAEARFCGVCGNSMEEPSPSQEEEAAIVPPASSGTSEGVERRVEQAVEAIEPTPVSLSPLSVGALIGERYRVMEVLATAADSNTYAVVDTQQCWQCKAEIAYLKDEFCPNCGAPVGDSAPEAFLRLREVSVVEDGTTELLKDNGRFYVLLETEEAPDTTSFMYGISLEVGQSSDAGMMRELDEDAVFSLTLTSIVESHHKPTIGLYIVADGMGGYEGGEVASKLAIRVASEQLLRGVIFPVVTGEIATVLDDAVLERIQGAIQDANKSIFELRRKRQSDMGTTITLALIVEDTAYIANVGDSRTYFWGAEGLQQITVDHSLINSLISAGQAEPYEIYTHPQRNIIYRCLGDNPTVEVDTFTQKLTPGSSLLLCCDGLWEMTRDEGIESVLVQNNLTIQQKCDDLVRAANRLGGEDNISVILVGIEDVPLDLKVAHI